MRRPARVLPAVKIRRLRFGGSHFLGIARAALARSGAARAKNAYDDNLITCHRVRYFRSLVF